MNISSSVTYPPSPATQASKPPTQKLDPDHDGDNEATESKAAAAREASKSQNRLDVTA